MIINIRGTNGSGKTHLARQMIGENPDPVDLNFYDAPTKKDPSRRLRVEGYAGNGVMAIGSYRQGCGGMDTIPSFAIQQGAIQYALELGCSVEHVLCEGVLASTVAGSWLDFFRDNNRIHHEQVLIAYLDTPLELCLERIRARQIAAKGETREIKVDLVRDKIKAINATRAKFDAAGIDTVNLRHDRAFEDLKAYVAFKSGRE